MEATSNIMRIKAIMDLYSLTQTEMAAKIGIHQTNLSEMLRGKRNCGDSVIAKLRSAMPEINPVWLITGEGEMLKPQQPSVQQNNYNGNNNYVVGGGNSVQCECCGAAIPTVECEEVQAAPFVPESLAVRPGIDVVEELEKREGELELSPIRTEMPITCWYRMIDDSLYPDYKLGENLALLAYPQGKEKPIPGKAYVIQTESNGMIPRILFPEGRDFKARSLNPEKYPDFTIERDDVVWIFKILFAVRR